MSDAMTHLGKVLSILSDLSPDHTCRAIENAFDFWNANNPDGLVIEPSGFGYTILVNKMPHFDDDYDSALERPTKSSDSQS